MIKAVFWDWSGTIEDVHSANTLNQDALNTIKIIYNKGLIQGIITNGQRKSISEAIIKYALKRYFMHPSQKEINLICAPDGYAPKPSSDMFFTLLKKMPQNFNSSDILFIGDSEVDLSMSKNCNCQFLNIIKINQIEQLI